MRLHFRSLLLGIALALPALLASARAGEIGPFTGPEADAEAARLYERANDFVNNVVEGQYSYSYVQFHWKRAGSNIDRILRAYPSSPTAARLRSGQLIVGPFTPDYFKNRVLPRLEEKKVASFDAVNNAIFLYNLPGNKDEAGRRELLAQIIITLCRQKRWGEALNYPVLAEGRAWLWRIIVRQAAYKDDALVEKLLLNSPDEEHAALLAIIAESRAFRGDTLEELGAFLKEHAEISALQANVFAGLVRRQIAIQRALLLNQPLKSIYDGVDAAEKPEQIVDLAAYLAAIPAGPVRQSARENYAHYLAALGRLDEARSFASPADRLGLALGYASHLLGVEEYQSAIDLPATLQLSQRETVQYRIQLIELLAQAGRDAELSAVRSQLPADQLTLATYHEWTGRIHSIAKQLVVREHTFANLPLTDPNLIGRLICEWSLTPNRTLRGAAAWDAIVYKFAPGFENLPPPKDRKKVEAAGR